MRKEKTRAQASKSSLYRVRLHDTESAAYKRHICSNPNRSGPNLWQRASTVLRLKSAFIRVQINLDHNSTASLTVSTILVRPALIEVCTTMVSGIFQAPSSSHSLDFSPLHRFFRESAPLASCTRYLFFILYMSAPHGC